MRLAALVPALVACLALALPACKKEESVVVEPGTTVVDDDTARVMAADQLDDSVPPVAPVVPNETPAAGDGTEVTLEIHGLHCEQDCVPRVREMLEHASGVESATVDYAGKSAVVKVRPGTDPADVAAAVEGGFSASVQ